MERNQLEEDVVVQDFETLLLVSEVLVLGFVVVVEFQSLSTEDDALVGVGDAETRDLLHHRVERLLRKEGPEIPDLDGPRDIDGD